jgi:hypothetical protein
MSDYEYECSVRTMEGTLVKGFDLMADAETNAKQRNDRAEKLGILTRYEETNQPAPRGKQ